MEQQGYGVMAKGGRTVYSDMLGATVYNHVKLAHLTGRAVIRYFHADSPMILLPPA